MLSVQLWIWALVLIGGCAGRAHFDAGASDDGAVALRHLLRQLPVPADGRGRQRHQWLQNFYQRRDAQPAWTNAHGVRARADDLLDELSGVVLHGLDPDAYGHTELRAAVARLRDAGAVDPMLAAAVDIGLTAAFLTCADDLRRGAVDPAIASASWVRQPAVDLSGLLATAISLNQVAVNLRRLAPAGVEYRRLQRALAERPAVASAASSIDRLRTNLERWRWLPRDLGSRYLLVRIADFELDYVVDGSRQTRRVIVGEPFRQTPQFASEITHIIVHPAWHVPPRIAEEELLVGLDGQLGGQRAGNEPVRPRVAQLRQLGFEAWTHGGARVDLDSLTWNRASGFSSKYRLVQHPGGSNPLGRVKLDLLNPFAIYLHDTPGAGLFMRSDRGLSHGCVRVEGIVELAQQLLGPSTLQQRRFDALLTSGETGRVDLPAPLPVYFMYWTVRIAADGQVQETEDLYNVDARLLDALNQAAGARHWLDAARHVSRCSVSHGPRACAVARVASILPDMERDTVCAMS